MQQQQKQQVTEGFETLLLTFYRSVVYCWHMNKNATKNLVPRIMTLATRAQAYYEQMGKGTLDWDKYDEEAKAMDAEITAIDKAAGPGLAVGRVLTFGVADGNASYLITKVRKNDVIVEWVPLWDCYWSNAVGLSTDKRHHVVLRSTAESYTRFASVLGA